MTNQLIMQAFEWYLPADGNHWKTVKASIPQLQHLGVTELWLPPAFKGTGINDVGYGVYDLFDLGNLIKMAQSLPNTVVNKNISTLLQL